MNLEEVRKRVAELDVDPGWYQNIDLKNGINTKSRVVWGEAIDHPRIRWEAIEPAFPKSFAGKTVLDVGCNAGFFSFLAADRDAKEVCGIDSSPKYIDQAKFANEARGDIVDFRVCKVNALHTLEKTFDVTFCIGLLYHVGDIWGAIKELSRVTSEMTIVESAILNDDDETPLMRVAVKEKTVPGIWHPNIAALQHLFEAAGYSHTKPLFKAGGRGGIIAYK